MNSNFGTKIKLDVFGESHGAAIGAVLTGIPAGIDIPYDSIAIQGERRAPGRDKTSTPRKEEDTPEFLSGVLNGKTTGAPIAVIIRNKDTRSNNYDNVSLCPRPSHSDYPAYVKYSGFNDIRGGGHFSGRLTAPIVALGTICREVLKQKGITVGGHIARIGNVVDTPFDAVNVTSKQLSELSQNRFALNDNSIKVQMEKEIEKARLDGDSVGGVVELAVTGIPAGIGNPMFNGVENILSNALYGIPAVKAIAFGDGFEFGSMRGSDANDQMYFEGDTVKTKSNHCGGICGGITNGMPVIIKVALKPTPSISKPQETVNLENGENTQVTIEGRHDPCIVPRALPALEAMLSIATLDLIAQEGKI